MRDGSPSTRPCIYDRSGKPEPVGSLLAQGGQGAVYTLERTDGVVVKVYGRAKLRSEGTQLRERIDAQIAMKDKVDERRVAWPQIPVFNARQEWIGYAMRRVNGQPMSKLAHPMLFGRHFPGCTRVQIVDLAMDLVMGMKALHRAGVLMGDVNLNNVVADPATNRVMFIDADSYQFSHGGRQFTCPVGRPEMTPPEHQGKRYDEIIRTVESDLFSLAILLFQCFMMGRHPYDSIAGGSPVDNLRQGRFPYGTGGAAPGTNGAVPKGPWYLIWSHLPYRIKELFIRTLKDGLNDVSQRATLEEWTRALQRYRLLMVRGELSSSVRPTQVKPKGSTEITTETEV